MSPRYMFRRGNQGGFTLIEMAVVLLVIGLILGAVSIGRDLQRQAEYKSIAQKFVYQWKVAYDAYYEKAGVVVGDSQIAPTFAVNGNSAHVDLFTRGTADYALDAGRLPYRICGAPDEHAGAIDSGDPWAMTPVRTTDPARNLRTLMKGMGIRMPPGRAEGREDRYVYLDTNGNPQELRICFQWNPPYTASNSGNVMVVIGGTPDLMRMIDQMIDGKADAREGMFRQQNIDNDEESDVHFGAGDPGSPGVEWQLDNRHRFGQLIDDVPENLDEDQVVVMTGHWKMNQ